MSKAEDIVTNKWELDWSEVHLISGGAAWAGKWTALFCAVLMISTDHAAIRLFLAHPGTLDTIGRQNH
jgi:hypothetical protein